MRRGEMLVRIGSVNLCTTAVAEVSSTFNTGHLFGQWSRVMFGATHNVTGTIAEVASTYVITAR